MSKVWVGEAVESLQPSILFRAGRSMVLPAAQKVSAAFIDSDIQVGIVERYIHDVLNARFDLIESNDRHRRTVSNRVLTDTAMFFADHMQAVAEARDRLAHRTDRDGRAMYALIGEVISSHLAARDHTLAIFERLRRDP